MRRRVVAVALTAALATGLTLLTAPGAAATGSGAGSGRVTLLAASLKGANEVPGPGDPDGRGRAFVRLGGGKACFLLEWSGIGAPAASHIHQGAAGGGGPGGGAVRPAGAQRGFAARHPVVGRRLRRRRRRPGPPDRGQPPRLVRQH